MKLTLRSGNLTQEVEVAERNLVAVVGDTNVEQASAHQSAQRLIRQAIEQPIRSKRLERLLSRKSRVAVVVDDATRSTPTKEMLDVLLEKLISIGVAAPQITIVVATGLHRDPSEEEKLSILGPRVLGRYEVKANNASCEADFTRIGQTRRGTPVVLNNSVIKVDLVIACGIIKTHSFAGFTGGAKSILPGVASRDAILANHRYDFVDYPNGVLGDADRSLVRQDAEDAVSDLPLFIINVVKDQSDTVIAAVAGHPVAAHRAGVESFMRMATSTVKTQADVALVEGGYSSQLQLYQALGSIDCVASTLRPVLREEGRLVLLAECREGMGSELFKKLFSNATSPKEILSFLRNGPPQVEQWAIQRLAFFLTKYRISLVSSGLAGTDIAWLGIEQYATLTDAFAHAVEEAGENAKVLVVRRPDFVVPLAG